MYEMGEAEIQAVARVIRKGQLFRYRGGEGGEVDQFETRYKEMLGASHFLTVTSGTAALISGLVGLGIGPGDEVIVPAYTFMATPLAVLNVGAIPVVAEVDESLLIDPNDVVKKISPRTKAIIPVHMQGLPCNMTALKQVAQQHGIAILEDACQAVGGSYQGKRLGSIGDAGAFSFNHFKNISCGEGGGLATSNRKIYERALIYHDCGSAFRLYASSLQEPVFAGGNFRLNEVLGAILNEQLKRLDNILSRLRERKKWLREALSGCPAYQFSPVHDEAGDCGCVLTLLFDSAESRKATEQTLKAAGHGVSSPIDFNQHVYIYWTPLLERRGAHHPALDAYRLPENRFSNYVLTKESCPRSLDILSRTLTLYIPIAQDKAWFENLGAAVQQACAVGV